MTTKILFSMPQVVTIFTPGAVSVSTPLNRVDFKIYRNTANRIEFLIKTADQRPATTLGNLDICFVDPDTKRTILKRPLAEIDKLRGHYRLLIDSKSSSLLESKHYQYHVVFEDAEMQEPSVLFSDENRNTVGYLIVDDSVSPVTTEPTSLKASEFLFELISGNEIRTSPSVKGSAQFNNIHGNQTVTVKCLGFTGEVEIQASLDNIPADTGWFKVGCRTFNNFTGLCGISFVGNHMWLRAVITKQENLEGEVAEMMFKVT